MARKSGQTVGDASCPTDQWMVFRPGEILERWNDGLLLLHSHSCLSRNHCGAGIILLATDGLVIQANLQTQNCNWMCKKRSSLMPIFSANITHVTTWACKKASPAEALHYQKIPAETPPLASTSAEVANIPEFLGGPLSINDDDR